MREMLADLWNGNLAPVRDLGRNNEEIQHLKGLIASNGEKLEKTLSDAQKKHWENYILCIEECFSLMVEEAFCDGVHLGTKLTIEALI